MIVGGSGFVGTMLTNELISKGYNITIIDIAQPRKILKDVVFVKADLSIQKLDTDVLDGCFGVINLAGATIGKRWNKEYEKLLYTSRVNTTNNIVSAIEKTRNKPKVLICASGIGFYGNRGADVLTEKEPVGSDFLAHLCADWEAATSKASAFGVRTVSIRTGNVLGPGGLLASLLPLFKIGLGGYFGSGSQFMPWVHWKDIVGVYLFALENNISGPFNACAGPAPTQKELFKAFGHVIHAPFVWAVPYFVAKLALGNFAGALVASQNAVSDKLSKKGYKFAFNDLGSALGDIYKI